MFSLVWGACLALPNRVVLNHAKTLNNIGKPMVVDICARDACVRVCQENIVKPMKFINFSKAGD